MPDLTLVSLFDGVGGFPLAFERAGVRTVATVEIDRAAATLTAKRFPDASQFDDVTKVSGDELRAAGFIPDRGIVTAGWPCQDNSVAGRRAGLDGARSGLWWHVVRLLDETRPRWFVGENVPGLLSVNDGRDFGAILGSLAELGYGVAYRVLDAKYFGVPQQRRRVFIVGHLGAPWGAPAQVLLEPESGGGDSPQSAETGAAVARVATVGAGRTRRAEHVAALRTSGPGGNGGPDDNAAQGGPIVVQPLAIRGRGGGSQLEIGPEGGPYNTLRAGDGGSSRQSLVAITGQHTHALTAEGADASEDGTGRGTPIVAYAPGCAATLTSGRSATKGVNAPGRRQEDDTNLVAVETVVRRLTPLECERLQGFPDGWSAGQSDSQRYREMGNSLAVPVVEWISRRLVAADAQLAAA